MVAQLGAVGIDSTVSRLVLATALGLFLGLEREWSHETAGIRTFALISLLGAVFTVIDRPGLLIVGGGLLVLLGLLIAVTGLLAEDSLSLTTPVSMLVAYGAGVLVGEGLLLEGVIVTVLSSLLLVFKRQLHRFAWGLTKPEIQSAAEFAILAFVIFPLLPAEPVAVELGRLSIEVELRIVWLMVVTVAAIGFVNYAVVQSYGGRGIAITGFFGGLASSTAVVGTMVDHVRQRPETTQYAVAAILLADAAMALRNLAITLVFTLSLDVSPLYEVVLPLGVVVVASVVIAAVVADWDVPVEMSLDTPFSMRNALTFGVVFLLIVVAGAVAHASLGTLGLYAASFVTGLISSAGATISAVLLYRNGSIGAVTATVSILLATAASIVVKAGLTSTSQESDLTRRVALWSVVLLVGAGAVTLFVTA